VNGQTFYTLLGWDGISLQLTQKIIDVLYFDRSDHPHFGSKIFQNFDNDGYSRIFFKYSSSASMVLRYDNQYLVNNKKWNPEKKRFETDREQVNMIVCEELVPVDPQLEGQFEYYVPSEVFDGFVFRDGMWNYFKNVDVRNKSH
jgi:hypothetical protein